MTLPADLDTALKAIPALAAWPARAWEIEQLGGVTNRNYRLRRRSSGGGAIEDDFVLRLPGSGTASYLNRPAGIYNAMQAAAIGIAPPVFFTDVTHGWQLSRYLSDSRPLEAADLRAPGLLSAVGGLLGRLQRSAGVFQHELRPFAIADRYLDLAPQPGLLRLRRAAHALEREIEEAGIPLVPAHIDPNPSNFLLSSDNRLYLIDWEFSAMADPAWDLAAIALEGGFTAAEAEALLAAAGRAADAPALRRLDLFRGALCLVASSWAYVEIAAGNDSTGLKRFAEQRAAAFADWLRILFPA